MNARLLASARPALLPIVAGMLLIAAGPPPPPLVARQLPPGHSVIASAHMPAGPRQYWIVALERRIDPRVAINRVPARPLLIFELRGDRVVPVGRNDQVVLRSDEGGQCDPFDDGTIAVSGRYFTVENGVACGQHWTNFVTFRLTPAGFVFDNERSESWRLNPSQAPDAEALIRDGPQHIRRDPPGRVTRFADWRRRR